MVISKGESYVFHPPPSILYLVKSTSEVASLVESVTSTAEKYQPLFPEVPAREISVVGGVLSILMVFDLVLS